MLRFAKAGASRGGVDVRVDVPYALFLDVDVGLVSGRLEVGMT